MAVVTENRVRVSDATHTGGMGRSRRNRNQTPLLADHLAGDDREVWLAAYDEARGRGSGRNVASSFANQRLRRLREERDGIAIPGARDYAAYR